METIQGAGVYPAVAIGPLYHFKKATAEITPHGITDPAAEVARFEDARTAAIARLGHLYQKAVAELGETEAAILDVHRMMLEDPDFAAAITTVIETQLVNAEYAVKVAEAQYTELFTQMEDPYMRERAADVKDISERLLRGLDPARYHRLVIEQPSIIVADDLAPSETLQLDKAMVLGFATAGGAVNSHTAILARTMGLPAVVAAGEAINASLDGRFAALDGEDGVLYADPDVTTLEVMAAKRDALQSRRDGLQALIGQPNVTRGGREIALFANVGGLSDLDAVLVNDAGGIGLFRSEFLYLEANAWPAEDDLYAAYRQTLETMAGRKVIIRTLDIGSDKQATYFGLPDEENPALGLRAIRICLTQPEIFKTQLRALYRAAPFGQLSVMFPMVTSVWEVRQIKAIMAEVEAGLTAEGVSWARPGEIGIMIETPAAVMVSRELAAEVDFFSIGTNDLTQYTLAIDRQNQSLAQFYDPHHPAVLRLIELAVENAHAAGIWIGICGELGADPELTGYFLDLGIDELSVSPTAILPLRQIITDMD
ncbi:MAG: phosphoenolpyruvate--protein phosphotransferase [Propionibacteriaceae bacterium]|jgi:phosphotransferase system enzyme I (PtsI)|nr:phosphoenolpyruvate--protein phosphotransferase [Propionibacteriaceae bacterium]